MCAVARVRGIEMTFDYEGAGDAVVLLHGFPLDRTMWREQAEALRGEYRVVAPDLRGHGGSGLGQGPSTMEEMASDVSGLLGELGVGRAVVCGLSMGGYAALAFRRLFPERVAALVLADTRATPDDEGGRRTREETALRALAEGMGPIAEAMLPKLLAPATIEQRPDTVERVRRMILGNRPEGAAAALRGMALRRDQTDLLPEISVPALVVVGDEDRLTTPSDAALMRDLLPDARLAVIEGAAHLSNVEGAAEFNGALLGFLRECRGKGVLSA